MKPDSRQMGDLDVLYLAGENTGPHAIVLHGYGANQYDLLGLATELKWPVGTNLYFPNGPLSIPIMPGYEGRAWFPIDWDAVERAPNKGSFYASIRPPGLDESRDKLLRLIAETKAPLDKILLVGFSQGAMLALDVALSLSQNVGGLILFSAALLDEPHWREKSGNKKDQRFFQSHGQQDDLLSFQYAEKLYGILHQSGWEGPFAPFRGGHEIPRTILGQANTCLQTWFR